MANEKLMRRKSIILYHSRMIRKKLAIKSDSAKILIRFRSIISIGVICLNVNLFSKQR